MTNNFLERNKKKSALAALLLLLRQRKLLALLLLLVIGASTLFVAPSSFLVDVPGGARMAAGVAWIASRMGVNVSRWGLASGPVSFGDLLAAFQSARMSGREQHAGWGPFFASKAGAGTGAGSLAYVVGSRADIGDTGAGPIAAVVNPEQAAKDDGSVALDQNDLGGQRESFVQAAFAGGFFNGLIGGARDGANAQYGANALSGGAYAARDFFSGSASAASSGGSGAAASSGLQNLPTVGAPTASLQNGYAGRMSSRFARSVQASEMQGEAGAASLGGGRAYTQLAEGNGQAQLATTDCSGNCPGEYAATATGAIYDGNSVNSAQTNGIVTAPAVDGITSPNVPSEGQEAGTIQSAQQMTQDAQTCQNLDAQYGPEEDSLNSQMQSLSQQFANASCGSGGCSQSKVNYCNSLGNQMRSTCSQYMSVRCQHTRACPLTAQDAATTCSSECTQGGNGITNSNPIVIGADENGNANGQGASNQ